MAVELVIPKLGMTMTEGTLVDWLVADGADVSADAPLFHLTTEKLDHEEVSPGSGRLLQIAEPGSTLPCGTRIGWLLGPGESAPDGAAPGGSVAGPTEADATASSAASGSAGQAVVAADERIIASPAARVAAAEWGVSLGAVTGTGPGGRIVLGDVRTAAAQPRAEAAPTTPAATTAETGTAATGTAATGTAATGTGPIGMAATGTAATGTGPIGTAPAGPVSPVARKVAETLGVDLATVRGTGPGGRITKEDVEAAAKSPAPSSAAAASVAAPTAAAASTTTPSTSVPVTGMRKVIAERMHESLQQMAQLTLFTEATVDDLVALRTQLVAEWADEGVKPSYTDLVIRAAAKALRKHPSLNAELRSGNPATIELLADVHIGMAVALDPGPRTGPLGGLIVPVVRHTDRLTVREIAAETTRLATAARDGKATLDDITGATFSVTALGSQGVDGFTPIINPPNVAILGIGRIKDGVRWDGDRPCRSRVITLSLTFDHRFIDGAPAAEFLKTVRELLESPFRLLV